MVKQKLDNQLRKLSSPKVYEQAQFMQRNIDCTTYEYRFDGRSTTSRQEAGGESLNVKPQAYGNPKNTGPIRTIGMRNSLARP